MGDERGRIERVRAQLEEIGLDGTLITDDRNRRYLSGFTGTAGWLLITGRDILLLTDSRYWDQALQESPHLTVEKVTQERGGLASVLKEILAKNERCRNIAVESDSVSVTLWENLKDQLGFCVFTPVRGMVEKLRLVKDEEEISHIKKAAGLAMDAFKAFRALVRPGMTERELASELDCALRRAGLAPAGFETIVAGGSNASRPHARSTWRAVEEGELLLIDFGGVYEGYHCDVTRTIPVGSVSARHIDLYRVVEEAQRRALAAIRSGMLCSDLDGLARAVITDAGYGDCFGHSLGHGLGLSVHEGPGIKRGNEDPLSSGMVFTIEPGIYLPGFAGVRIEDMVVLRDGGPDLLTDVAYEEFQGAG